MNKDKEYGGNRVNNRALGVRMHSGLHEAKLKVKDKLRQRRTRKGTNEVLTSITYSPGKMFMSSECLITAFMF
jgi:hypothetical protein